MSDRTRGQMSLFGDAAAPEPPPAPAAPPPLAASLADPDASARAFAIDPRNNVVLEASAGTGKTSVLVWRYVNLLKAGVEPANILAITFTRKAAAEMRERIVRELRDAAARSEFDKARWSELRDRLGEIAISTIDAFCLSLLREFPIEADLDPGFDMADETEVPRLIEESLDRSLRIFTALARTEPDVAAVLAQLGTARTREGLASLLARRLVAWDALDRFLARGPSDLTTEVVCRRAATALRDALRTAPGGLRQFLADGPAAHPRFQLLLREMERLPHVEDAGEARVRALLDRVALHFLTNEGVARKGGTLAPYKAADYPSADAAKRHRTAVFQIAPQIERVMDAFGRDLNVVLARGIRRMFAIALAQYRKSLEERSVLDFSDVLQRALGLLRQMDEFSQSRFRLESRYHHVLVDEFQDTSRAQWELVSLLIQAWGEGLGLATQPSIFIVGDRKQSIYRFRDAEVAVLHEAGRYIEALRPGAAPRRSISRSFRALPALLEFVNDVFTEMSQPAARPDDFTYSESDRFPVEAPPADARGPVLGISVGDEPEHCASAVADEIARVLREETVRDRKTGVARQARPGDIAILFRSRASHREFERELELRGVPTYVYKGLGFFDADEIKDVTALLRFLSDPTSELRAAAFLRSRFVRLSDRALAQLAPRVAASLTAADLPAQVAALDEEDRSVLLHVRRHLPAWLAMVDRVPPADLLEELLPATAYAYELRGARRAQAWENLKKMRGLVRRIQNRGYATLRRIADHIDALTAGDESNAVLEALEAVNLMTVHASKGLEFPVVFVVNLAKGASGPAKPVRVVVGGPDDEPSVSVGPFMSETDEAERDREKQETRRLLYVALTRARDRLYLSSVVKDGTLQPGRGSLAEVLPDSLRALFARAATALPDIDRLGWAGASGRTFEWRVCRYSPERAPDRPLQPAARPTDDTALDLNIGSAGGARTDPERVAITRWLERNPLPGTVLMAEPQERLVGTLVHRLFQFGDAQPAMTLLRAEERAAVVDAEALVARAVAAWRAMRARPDVADLLASGAAQYEVPFSMRVEEGGRSLILRGTIDCLVRRSDGSIVVIEFKTGARRPAHDQQVQVYRRAVRVLFPGSPVEISLIYP
jgi:ATP-dependent helicase/nuclease subunit A